MQEALSAASLGEAPFGSLDLCVEGFGESRALRTLDDYLTMTDVDFARYGRRLLLAALPPRLATPPRFFRHAAGVHRFEWR